MEDTIGGNDRGFSDATISAGLSIMRRRILLVNPWITDFAAHDLWARPLGLLSLAGVLRQLDCEPQLIDCTDRHHPSLSETPYRPKAFSCGRYPAEEIAKPGAIAWVPRKFKRFGISIEAFRASLDAAVPLDLILVGSRMTHWYPGVREATAVLRERFPEVPLVLGGVYPTLFPDHARRLAGADHVIHGEGENAVVGLVNDLFRTATLAPPYDIADLETLPRPAYDLLSGRDTLPFMLSRGCPRQCTYCASHHLFGRFRRRDPLRAADDLIACVERFGFSDVAFYDDALLADAGTHFLPFCDRLIDAGIGVRFHTPNGLDYGSLDDAVAERMARVGFKTIRLSLETADRERLRRMGRDAELSRFESALVALQRAGFARHEVGVYILFGLPGQTRGEVERTVDYVQSLGATPKLAEYCPLPATAQWEGVRHVGTPPVEQEPLLTNNSVFYRIGGEFPDSWLNELRHCIRDARPENV